MRCLFGIVLRISLVRYFHFVLASPWQVLSALRVIEGGFIEIIYLPLPAPGPVDKGACMPGPGTVCSRACIACNRVTFTPFPHGF